MTCIVGFIADDGIYMGADSAGTCANFKQRTRLDKKVFINGDFIIGFTSSFRMGQLLQYKFNPPKYILDLHGDIFKYMCTEFVDSLRKCFKDGGYAQIKDGEDIGGCFLVGFKGRLFEIESDFQICESADKYSAVGCGEEYALGTLYSLKNGNITTEEQIERALESAEYFSPGVRAPFNILKLGSEVKINDSKNKTGANNL